MALALRFGVALGGVFFGESMFSAQANGSRVALLDLARAMVGWDMPLLDAQVASAHLARLGATALPRAAFLARVRELTAREGRPGSWQAQFPALRPADLAG